MPKVKPHKKVGKCARCGRTKMLIDSGYFRDGLICNTCASLLSRRKRMDEKWEAVGRRER